MAWEEMAWQHLSMTDHNIYWRNGNGKNQKTFWQY